MIRVGEGGAGGGQSGGKLVENFSHARLKQPSRFNIKVTKLSLANK